VDGIKKENEKLNKDDFSDRTILNNDILKKKFIENNPTGYELIGYLKGILKKDSLTKKEVLAALDEEREKIKEDKKRVFSFVQREGWWRQWLHVNLAVFYLNYWHAKGILRIVNRHYDLLNRTWDFFSSLPQHQF